MAGGAADRPIPAKLYLGRDADDWCSEPRMRARWEITRSIAAARGGVVDPQCPVQAMDLQRGTSADLPVAARENASHELRHHQQRHEGQGCIPAASVL